MTAIWIIGSIILTVLVIIIYMNVDPGFGGKPGREQMEKLAK